MRTELRCAPHSIRPGETVVEVWYGKEFIATVTSWDGPGVCVISKHGLIAETEVGRPNVTTVHVHYQNPTAPFRCRFCGAPSWVDPSDQTMPPDYCHPEDHGAPPDDRS